jgi:hypothetical protein
MHSYYPGSCRQSNHLELFPKLIVISKKLTPSHIFEFQGGLRSWEIVHSYRKFSDSPTEIGDMEQLVSFLDTAEV